MRTAFGFAAAAASLAVVLAGEQPGPGRTCPTDGSFTGNPAWVGANPRFAPLRGNVACVDGCVECADGGEARGPLSTRPIAGRGDQDAVNIYGPMEAGFSSRQWPCLGDLVIPGGIDTLLAEDMLHHVCQDDSLLILDFCGGHATPYHYHERMSCLYTETENGHSSRVGTALDGNGIYGSNIEGGVVPTDLDVCNGRHGVTPDSGGQVVYYYVTTQKAPFTVGCFGPVHDVDECRELYAGACDRVLYHVETDYGEGDYDLDCPCFDEFGSNVPGTTGRPAFLPPLNAAANSTNSTREFKVLSPELRFQR